MEEAEARECVEDVGRKQCAGGAALVYRKRVLCRWKSGRLVEGEEGEG